MCILKWIVFISLQDMEISINEVNINPNILSETQVTSQSIVISIAFYSRAENLLPQIASRYYIGLRPGV